MRQYSGPLSDLKPFKGCTGAGGGGMWSSSLLIQRRMSDSHEERLMHQDVHVTPLYTVYNPQNVALVILSDITAPPKGNINAI